MGLGAARHYLSYQGSCCGVRQALGCWGCIWDQGGGSIKTGRAQDTKLWLGCLGGSGC